MMVYKIEFYAYLSTYPKYKYFFFHFELRSGPELDPDPIFFLQT